MMKTKITLMLLAVTALAVSCKNIDNYVAPGDSGVFGSITDIATNQPIQTEQPNGFRIRLLELSYATPQSLDFWGKSDGTFQNTKLFAGQYSVQPIEAPFIIPEPMEVDVNGQTRVDFKVEPFLRITEPVVTAASGKVTVRYQLSRTTVTEKIAERAVFISKSPTATNTVNLKKVSEDLMEVPDEDVLKKTYQDTVIDLAPGTYYLTVGARTNNAFKRFNYSQTIKITVP
jgi:hypothetical protein